MKNDIITTDPDVQDAPLRIFGGGHVCMFCGEPAELVCDECEAQNQAAEAQREAEQEAAHKADRRAAFREKVGDYADTELARLPEGAAKQIATTYALGSGAGLTLSGTGGKGKTRAAVFIAGKELETGAWVEFYQCGELRQQMAAFAKAGEWGKGIRPLMKCDILVLDDLGNHEVTRTLEELLLAVLEHRTMHRKRTFVTTQYTTDQLRGGEDGKGGIFSTQQMADAILRRIGRQFATIVNTVTDTIQPWK